MDIVKRLRSPEVLITDGQMISPVAFEAADEIERLRKENQRQKEHIMLLYSMIQTEHEIIRVVDLKETE